METNSAPTSAETTASALVEKTASVRIEKQSTLKSVGVQNRTNKRKSAAYGAKTKPETQSATYENARFVLQIADGNLKDITEVDLPKTIELSQNYPNPFNPSTIIKFALPQEGSVRIDLFDVTGKLVRTLVNETRQAGFYQINFNVSQLSSGMYFYRILTNQGQITKKMMLIK